MGLREEKKQFMRKKIIDVSKEAFMSQGYNGTSTKEIATRAGIGSGTLFNYFPSKADILLEIIASKPVTDIALPFPISDHDSDVLKSILSLLNISISPALSMPKQIMKEFIVSSLASSKSQDELIQNIIDTDQSAINHLSTVISDLIDQSLVPNHVDSKILARLIFSSLFLEIGVYFFDERITKEDFVNTTKRHINYLVTLACDH